MLQLQQFAHYKTGTFLYFYNIEKSSFYLRFIIKILLKNMWKITKLLFIMIW